MAFWYAATAASRSSRSIASNASWCSGGSSGSGSAATSASGFGAPCAGARPVTPLPSAICSTCCRTARTWSPAAAPWKSGTGWPPTIATTVGTLSTWKAAAICG
ncbi:hypothetical protein ASE27_04525 [Oerskovia sp. Root918]|nr:hypothetical protein ASE27_04525 [Oerskovia sp. Root918]